MRTFLLFSLLMSFAPVQTERPHALEKAKPLAEQILGEWVMVSYSRNGNPYPDRHGESWTFKGAVVHVRATDGETDDQTYRLDATKSPAHVDFIINSDGDAKALAIVKVENGQLTVCYRASEYGERPTSFASPPKSGIRLAVFACKRTGK